MVAYPSSFHVWSDELNAKLWGAPSPDGKSRIIVWSSDLYEKQASSDAARKPQAMNEPSPGDIRLTKDQGANSDPVFSPDDLWIYYSSNRSGSWQVWRMLADGSTPAQVTTDDLDNPSRVISPDRKRILLLSIPKNTPSEVTVQPEELRVVSLADGKTSVLARFTGDLHALSEHPFSPDGKRIVYVSIQDIPPDLHPAK
jgi:Tol biopolymer transport system component